MGFGWGGVGVGWILAEHISGTFHLVVFKVILRSFGALAIFPERHTYCSYSYDSFFFPETSSASSLSHSSQKLLTEIL